MFNLLRHPNLPKKRSIEEAKKSVMDEKLGVERKIVSRFSRGNVLLQTGAFSTKQEIEDALKLKLSKAD